MSLVELSVTRDVGVHPGDGFVRFGIASQTSPTPAYLWAKKADGEGTKPIYDVKVGHGDEAPGTGYEKLDHNLSGNTDKTAFAWFSLNEAQSADKTPIVQLKIVVGEDTAAGPGFEKIGNELNPSEADEDKKEYLCYITQKAQYKIDNPEYNMGEQLDVLDTADNWLLSTVIAVDKPKKRIRIHYEGWGAQWDEWLANKSKRIAPVGTYTVGVGKGGVIPPWPVANNQSKIKKVIKRMLTIEEKINKEEKLSETENNFFFQTEFKKFLLNVLNAAVDNDTKEHYEQVQTFFQIVIRLVIRTLKKDNEVPKLYQEVFQLLLDTTKSRFYQNHGNKGTEEGDTGKWATRSHDPQPEASEEAKIPSVFFVQNVNYFGDQGGFEALRARLTEREKDPFSLFSSTIKLLASTRPVLDSKWAGSYAESLNLRERVRHRVHTITDTELKSQGKEAFSSLLHNVQAILSLCLEGKDIAEYSEKIKLDIALRLLQAEVLEKKLDGINELLGTVKKVTWKIRQDNHKALLGEKDSSEAESRKGGSDRPAGTSSSTSSSIISSNTTGVTLLHGIPVATGGVTYSTGDHLKGSRQRSAGSTSSYDDDDDDGDVPYGPMPEGHGSNNAVVPPPPPEVSKYLTPELLISWVEENKVIPILLGNHEQILKRSPPVLKFLASQRALKVEYIDMIWNAGIGKNEEITRIVYEAISELASELSMDQLAALFKRIESKPLEDYHEFDLHFLKQFTINAVKATQEKPGNWFGLEIFWNMVQDDAKVNDEIAKLAVNFLKSLLETDTFSKQRTVYLDKCLEGVRNNESVVQRLRVAQLIFSIVPPVQTTYQQQREREREELNKVTAAWIAEVEQKHKLLELLVQDIQRYKSESAAAASRLRGPEATDPVLVGRYSHSVQWNSRLQFLSFILSSSQLLLNKDLVDKLWGVFMENPVHSLDSRKLFTWLAGQLKQQLRGKRTSHTLEDEARLHLFEGLLCKKVDYSTLPLEGYDCFEVYFVYLNYARNCLLNTFTSYTIVQSYDGLIGMDALWDIAIQSKFPRLAELSRQFLTALHVRLNYKMSSEAKKDIFAKFIAKCFGLTAVALKNYQDEKNVEKSTEYRRQVDSLVETLSAFLFRIDNGELIRTPRFHEGEHIRAVWKNQAHLSNPIRYEAQVMGVNPDGTYDVLYEDGDKDHHCPERNMFKLRPEEERKEEVVQDDAPKFPSQLISNNKGYFDLLFELLGLGDDIGSKVWLMLARLPLNARLADSVRSLPDQTGSIDWNVLLPSKSIIKLLYTLQIVDQTVTNAATSEIIINDDSTDEGEEGHEKRSPGEEGAGQPGADTSSSSKINSQDPGADQPRQKNSPAGADPQPNSPNRRTITFSPAKRWSEMFVLKGGFAHLTNIFLSLSVEETLGGLLQQQCLFVLLKLLLCFLAPTSLADVEAAHRGVDHARFVPKLLQTLRAMAEVKAKELYSKKKRPENDKADNNGPPPLSDEAIYHSWLIHYPFQLSILSLKKNPSLLGEFEKFGQWEGVVVHGLFHNHNYSVRLEVLKGILSLVENLTQGAQLRVFFLRLLLSVLPQLTPTSYCVEFFDVIQRLLKDSTSEDGSYDVKSLTSQLVTKIKAHPILENTLKKNTDEMLCGYLALLRQLLAQNPAYKEPLGVAGGLVEDVLKYLFDVPTQETARLENRPPKCKTPKTRKLAFTLLSELAKGNEAILRTLLSNVSKNHYISHSGGQKPQEWLFQAANEEKSQTGYVGIKNLGCICYMNACLQQLFMIPKLREGILAVDTSADEDLKESLMYQFQYLFTFLQESEKQYVNPAGFCHAFKDFDGKPTNVTIQEDSGGFLNKLIDRINERVKKTPLERVFQDTMGGVLSHELFGRGTCTHYREREEEFFSVQLELKNKKTLQESLEQFVQCEVLDGSNQYRCDKCGTKVDTLKRTCLKKVPPTIALIIKRFALDYTTFQTTKLNDKLVFPETLNLKPYSKEALGIPGEGPVTPQLQKQDSKAGDDEGDDKEKSKDGEKEEEKKDPSEDDSYWQFSLRGMIIHTGTATHGHYYSFIKEAPTNPQARWFEFNDTTVKDFNPSQIAEECFGGSDAQPQSTYGFVSSMGASSGYEKSRSAYILFYDRVSTASNPRERFPCPDRLLKEVMEENLIYWQDKAVYDASYFDFLWNLVETIQLPEPTEGKELVLEPPPKAGEMTLLQTVTELATRFVLFTLSRALHKESLPRWLDLLKKLYANNVPMCLWFLEQLMSQKTKWAKDFLLNCRDSLVRRCVCELVCHVLGTIAPLEQKALTLPFPEQKETKEEKEGTVERESTDTRGYVVRFIDSLIPLLRDAPPFWKSFDPYFQVLAYFAGLGRPEANYLLRHNMLAKILDFYLGDLSTHPEVNNMQIDKNGKRAAMGNSYDQPPLVNFLGLMKTLALASASPYPPEAGSEGKGSSTDLTPLSKAASDLLLYKDYLPLLMAEAATRKKAEQVVPIITYLVTEQKKLSERVIRAAIHEIEEKPYDKIRAYFRVLLSLVQLEDSLQDQRVEWILAGLLTTMESQSKYWKCTDMSIEHLIRFAKLSEKCRAWLVANNARLEWVAKWLDDHPLPPVMDEHMELHKPNRVVNNWSTARSEAWQAAGLSNARKKIAINLLREGKVLEKEDCEDSDQDLESRVFKVGDWVDARDRTEDWLPAQVKEIAGSRVLVAYDGWAPEWDEWLDKSDTRLQKLGTHTTDLQRQNIGKPRKKRGASSFAQMMVY